MARLSRICGRPPGALLAAILAVTASLTVAASPAYGLPAPVVPAGSGTGISLVPVNADPSQPESFFTLDAVPGARIAEAVLVTNQSPVAVTLTVAPVDGVTGQTTGSVYANQGDPVVKAGKWVSVPQSSVQLPPHSAETVPFTVTVPTDAVPGDHLAGISFESPPKAPTPGGFQITEIARNVIGVLVVVPGRAAFLPTLSGLRIQPIGLTGIASIVVNLKDDGWLLGKPTLRIALDGPDGYHRTLIRALDTVLPTDSVHYPFPWPDRLAQGRYHITAWLSGGRRTAVLHRTYRLGTKLAGTTQPLKPPSHNTRDDVLWIALAIGGVLVVGLLVVIGFLLLALRRRRKSEEDETHPDDQPIVEAIGTGITEL